MLFLISLVRGLIRNNSIPSTFQNNQNSCVMPHEKVQQTRLRSRRVCSEYKPEFEARGFIFHFKGGVGFRPFTFVNMILSFDLGAIAWTCNHNLRVVLGLCAPRSEKMGRKPNAKWNEIKLSFLYHPPLRADNLVVLNVKIG